MTTRPARFRRRLLALLLTAACALLGAGLLAPAAAAGPRDETWTGTATGGWPHDGSPTVTEGFDPPDVRWGAGHRGVDLDARPGQRVLAPADGRVVFVGRVGGKPVVVIDHGGVRSTLEPVEGSTRVSAPNGVTLIKPPASVPAGTQLVSTTGSPAAHRSDDAYRSSSCAADVGGASAS